MHAKLHVRRSSPYPTSPAGNPISYRSTSQNPQTLSRSVLSVCLSLSLSLCLRNFFSLAELFSTMSLSSFTTLDSNPVFTARSRAFGTQLRPRLLSRPSNVVVCSVNPPSASSLSVAQSASQGLSRIESLSQVSGVLGCQWGDEGKGKLVDILAQHFDIVARCQVLRSLSCVWPSGFVFFVIAIVLLDCKILSF